MHTPHSASEKSLRNTLLILALSAGPLLARADALDNWTAGQVVTNPTGTYGMVFSGVAYGNGRYVAVGEYNGDDNAILETSDDRAHWSLRSKRDYSILDLYDVTFGNGVFVAVGWDWFSGQNIYHSTNGIDWTPHYTAIGNVYRVAYGGGNFAAVGDKGLLQGRGTTNRTIYTSPDGVSWTAVNSGAPVFDPQSLNDVAYGAGVFLAVDSAQHIYKSTVGPSWARTTLSGAGNRISFCKDRFIIPAGPGTNLMSTDGNTWWPVTNGTGAVFGRVLYADGCYLALAGGTVFTSLDTTNWLSRALPLSGNVRLASVAYAERQFLVVGSASPGVSTPPWLPLACYSDPTVGVRIGPGFPPQLQVSGVVGQSYRIDRLDNLPSGNWQLGTSFPLSSSPYIWTDAQPTNRARFYRAVLLP